MEDCLADFYGNFKWNCCKKNLKRYYKRIPEHLHRRYKVGLATEYLARDNLNRYLKSKGIKRIRNGIAPNSYIIKYQFGKRKGTNKKGVDIWLRYFNEKSESQDYFIEVSGWKKMSFGISDDVYNRRFRDRFTTYDPKNKGTHVVMITKPNIPLIADRCKRDNIKLVAIPIHVTPGYLKFINGVTGRKSRFAQMQHEDKESLYGEISLELD